MPGIETPEDDRLQDREQHRRQIGAPNRARAIIILPPRGGVADTIFAFVVIHWRLRILEKHRQSCPMVAEAGQHFFLCLMQAGIGQKQDPAW